ncbi:DUF262 domain-containing protein [Yersinia enterocolitica]|uniref:DUF262 domain-containing protein n=1 Tax=Yersinia enterocolitica TaxID=630 RepID=UPI000D894337|nr:DUF262 domain-containing protein [Yersinia enterocolitica]SQA35841.1 Protein of uncharacterised function DUF262 [Yersinia enterocolitica]SUP63128.1 Protein of uncharacterised function DUF262 [Yersinia enterocolitica]
MSYIETIPLKNSTIMMLHAEKDEIQLSPEYQRLGGIWNKEKKQLLIDSILNDYDIPKIYFHSFDRETRISTGCNYAVIDGRQRLETIWSFIEGDFNLSSDFQYQRDESIQLSNLSYADIAKEYPRIKVQFDSFVLPIVVVNTDDEELIEDMFSRLNEAAPLNAAEKRNALGGYVVKAIRDISSHTFFLEKVKFANKRYQYMEVAARLLFTEYSMTYENKIFDTKKLYLDNFAKNIKMISEDVIDSCKDKVAEVLYLMNEEFSNKDPLLQSQGNMVLYYLLFKKAHELGQLDKIVRKGFFDFKQLLKDNRERAEAENGETSYELLEYDRLTQQGTNDSSNLKERFYILSNFFNLTDRNLV